MTRSPSYIAQNQFGFCFRMHIPRDPKNRMGKKELRLSLKTGNLSKAKVRARCLAGSIQFLFNEFGQENLFLKKLAPKRVNDLIKQYRDQAIEDAKRPANRNHEDLSRWDYYMREVETEDDLYTFMHELSSLEDWYKFKAVTGDYEGADAAVEKLCKANDIAYRKDSDEFRNLCRGMLFADSETAGVALDFLESSCPVRVR